MTAPEAALLRDALAGAKAVAGRLQGSLDRLAPSFPLTPESLQTLDEPAVESVDAFVKRFEQLEDLLARQVFKGIALLSNRLAHGYPTDPARQCAVLNRAWATAPLLLEALTAAQAHVARKGLLA